MLWRYEETLRFITHVKQRVEEHKIQSRRDIHAEHCASGEAEGSREEHQEMQREEVLLALFEGADDGKAPEDEPRHVQEVQPCPQGQPRDEEDAGVGTLAALHTRGEEAVELKQEDGTGKSEDSGT